MTGLKGRTVALAVNERASAETAAEFDVTARQQTLIVLIE